MYEYICLMHFVDFLFKKLALSQIYVIFVKLKFTQSTFWKNFKVNFFKILI